MSGSLTALQERFLARQKNLGSGMQVPSSETAEAKKGTDEPRPTGVARLPAVSHVECEAQPTQKPLSRQQKWKERNRGAVRESQKMLMRKRRAAGKK